MACFRHWFILASPCRSTHAVVLAPAAFFLTETFAYEQYLTDLSRCSTSIHHLSMASSLIPPSIPFFLRRHNPSPLFPLPNLRIPSQISRRFNPPNPRLRPGQLTPVRAGPPTTSTLILVFVFPLSLLIGTILVSLRISDKLDEKFLEELAVNQALLEGDDDDEVEEGLDSRGGEEERVLVKEEVGAARIRNRPKRQV